MYVLCCFQLHWDGLGIGILVTLDPNIQTFQLDYSLYYLFILVGGSIERQSKRILTVQLINIDCSNQLRLKE